MQCGHSLENVGCCQQLNQSGFIVSTAWLCCPTATTTTRESWSSGGPPCPSSCPSTRPSFGCCCGAATDPGNRPVASFRIRDWCCTTTTSCQSWRRNRASRRSSASWNGAQASFLPEVDSDFRSGAGTDRCSRMFRSRPGMGWTRRRGCCSRTLSAAAGGSRPWTSSTASTSGCRRTARAWCLSTRRPGAASWSRRSTCGACPPPWRRPPTDRSRCWSRLATFAGSCPHLEEKRTHSWHMTDTS